MNIYLNGTIDHSDNIAFYENLKMKPYRRVSLKIALPKYLRDYFGPFTFFFRFYCVMSSPFDMEKVQFVKLFSFWSGFFGEAGEYFPLRSVSPVAVGGS